MSRVDDYLNALEKLIWRFRIVQPDSPGLGWATSIYTMIDHATADGQNLALMPLAEARAYARSTSSLTVTDLELLRDLHSFVRETGIWAEQAQLRRR